MEKDYIFVDKDGNEYISSPETDLSLTISLVAAMPVIMMVAMVLAVLAGAV